MNGLWETDPTLCVILIFVAFFLVVVIVSIIKKLYYRVRWHKRYYIIPRVNIKGITSIAMTIALTVAILLVLAFLTAGLLAILFRAYPGWRIVVEQFLIQLGGLLFGPFIGLIIGALTDILTVALTSGMFHYGYFIICMAYGLIGGLISSLLTARKNNIVKFSFWSMWILIVLAVGYALYINFRGTDSYTISVLSLDLTISKYVIIWLITGFIGASVVINWLILGICRKNDIKFMMLKIHYNVVYVARGRIYRILAKTEKFGEKSVKAHANWYASHAIKMFNEKKKIGQLDLKVKQQNTKQHWYDSFIPVLIVCSIAQLVCNCWMLPYFDQSLSSWPLETWIALRALLYPILLGFNLLIIFPCYMAIKKLIKYDYRRDMIENINTPYME